MSHPGNRPDTEETQDRDTEIWRLRVSKKLTQARIAERVGITQQAVSDSLRRTRERLDDSFKDFALQVKIEQSEQLVEAAYEAWNAWMKSKKPAQTRTRRQEKMVTGSKDGKAQTSGGPADADNADSAGFDPENIPNLYLTDSGEDVSAEERARKIFEFATAQLQGKRGLALTKDITTTVTEGRTGDPRHLANFLKACEDLRKIWGADAPIKTEVTGADGGAVLMKHFGFNLDRVYGEPVGADASA